MKDFPLFPTDYGVASLVLREIPYRQEAYIRIRSAAEEDLPRLLEECVSFCRMAGAERVYAAGHQGLERYPMYTSVLRMACRAKPEEEKVRSLFPVTEETVTQWRELYNRRMAGVDNAATLEKREEEKLLSSTGAYFVHDRGELLGIGWLEEGKLLAMASAQPGRGQGEAVLHTLLTLTEGLPVELEVASTNEKAIRLYEKAGFLRVEELSRWFCVG